jgi:hypothetical protein
MQAETISRGRQVWQACAPFLHRITPLAHPGKGAGSGQARRRIGGGVGRVPHPLRPFVGPAETAGVATVEIHRRTRLEKGLPAELVRWLHRVVRVHAHLLAIVRLYGNPSKAGGQSNEGEAYAARAARGDRSLLYDCLTVSRDELDEIRAEVQALMDSAPPTTSPPGSPGKVEAMVERYARGDSLFVHGDATS